MRSIDLVRSSKAVCTYLDKSSVVPLNTDSGILPSPLPQPVGCRADTQIVCPGTNHRICEVQQCDGVENCPKSPEQAGPAWDEANCPAYNNVTFEPPTVPPVREYCSERGSGMKMCARAL